MNMMQTDLQHAFPVSFIFKSDHSKGGVYLTLGYPVKGVPQMEIGAWSF
ncbi:MAG TPA: hypothetical protein VK111_03035 [Virgibacillus sp.]|nr:hypothetical protein [Virgibacillus sp.]